MKRIKHYVVTYDNFTVLNRCLQSIFPALKKYSGNDYQVYIINNHSNFYIDSKFEPYVKILHNELRPDFSSGHLARSWNQAIINGFKYLDNPDCDILITSQNDCEFSNDFIPNLIELHKKYSFIQFGAGDYFISYTPDSIKKVGLWDERFCNIGYQEADYFLRQLIYNTDFCSINDSYHGRVHNSCDNSIVKNTTSGHDRGEISHMESKKYHDISKNVYNKKWGHPPSDWLNISELKNLHPLIDSYIMYPFFEKKVETLNKQKYVL
jgi:hypothetical protein